MKMIVMLSAVLVLVFAAGCTSYRYENKGGTTDTLKRTPDGGYERTTTYHNSGSGSGPQPSAQVRFGGGYGGWNQGGGYSPVVVPQAPSAASLMGMLPQ